LACLAWIGVFMLFIHEKCMEIIKIRHIIHVIIITHSFVSNANWNDFIQYSYVLKFIHAKHVECRQLFSLVFEIWDDAIKKILWNSLELNFFISNISMLLVLKLYSLSKKKFVKDMDEISNFRWKKIHK